VNSLPKTVTRKRRDCDLNPGPTAPESSTLTTRLPSQQMEPKALCSRLVRPSVCTYARARVDAFSVRLAVDLYF